MAARVTQELMNIRSQLKEKEEELLKYRQEGLWLSYVVLLFTLAGCTKNRNSTVT